MTTKAYPINILPQKGKRNILITSALPYVNATPHLGNLIGCVLSADVFSRFCRLKGYNSLYICGTDEYGTATEFKAQKENMTPKEICDKFYKIHKSIYEWIGIKFDYFGRTSTEKHTEITTEIFTKLDRNGHIEERKGEQYFCQSCDRFLADRFLEGICPVCQFSGARGDQCDSCGSVYEALGLKNAICKTCGGKAEKRECKHLYLNIPGLKDKVRDWNEEMIAKGGWSENTVSLSRVWLRDVVSRCITRSLKWGTPVPKKGYEDKVFYVWFDAPIGYISITANAVEGWREWWHSDEVQYYQFMGKDNVPFHTSIFPATLIGTGEKYTMASNISTTEYLKFEGGKFSKSWGRGVFGDDAKNSGIASDLWRYYLLSNRPETSDSDFDWRDLQQKSNSELNNNLGNFINRTLVFTKNKRNGALDAVEVVWDSDAKEVEAKINECYTEYLSYMENVKITQATRTAMKMSNAANNYYQSQKPWETVNTDPAKCNQTMSLCIQLCRLFAKIFEPFIPHACESIEKQINIIDNKQKQFSLQETSFQLKNDLAGHEIGDPKLLFRRIKDDEIEFLSKKFAGKVEKVFPLDLIVGTVEEILEHPYADRLWILKIKHTDNFSSKIVSNIKTHYKKEELINKKVIVIKNLRKSKFQGVSSNGMVLCAKKDDALKIVTTKAENGSRATPEGINPELLKVQKNFNVKKSFAALELKSNSDAIAVFDGRRLAVKDDPLFVEDSLADCDLV